ncbi:N-formylglutamate amidohydrolase (plasmid) [Skermanella sp. TT6]|uniref:N-formylglutamate amidohydrolase n=1 Tax=Skermanella cutis TaxID=2775420 RepID=A0ABX7BHT9_9PROT|nr:N-formylglutamate amidohydrolase [Skermanella sp. TT6]QQP92853.1 N-formylglutamate amidohydrolase [Skermanella sp. TT6]
MRDSAADWPDAVETVNPSGASEIVLICEHASNHIPQEYGRLGLSDADLRTHIAWDIGAAEVTRRLARTLDAPAFLGTYSRLLIDLNRPFESPASIPARSEATDVPGNIGLDSAEIRRRRRIVFSPFHDRIASFLDRRRAVGHPTRIVTIHSFTPVFLGVARPWHAGILFDRSGDFAHDVIEKLACGSGLNVAANQPYVVDREGDYAVPVHGTDRDLPAILVEIRNDLISSARGIADWSDRLAPVLRSSCDGRS